MALADTASLVVQLRLDDKFSGPLGRASGSLSRVQQGLFQTGKGVGQVAAGLGRVGIVAAGAAAAGLVTVTKLAGNFEAQLNTINTIAKTDNAGLSQIGEGIRETFRATGQPLDDLTNGYYDLLSAGVKVKDAQLELNTAVKLGIGGLGSTSEAVDLLTTAQNAYGLTAEQTTAAADIFAKAVADGKVRISEIAGSFANVAPTAHQFGVSIDEIGAAYGFLTARGVPAAEVTTQMNRAILDLVKPSSDAKKVLDELGTTGEELIKKQGLVGALQTMRDEAKKLGIPFQELFGRIEGYKFALQTTGAANRGFTRELERMHKAAGETDAQFAERQKGLNYQLSRLKALAQDAGITIGNALLPKLVPLVERLNTFISEHQDDIKQFGADLAKGIGDFADSIKEADIGNFIDGLKTIASVGKGVLDLFLKLPSPIQALVLGGAAINKISGGLVGAGVGNIAGGLIKIAFDRGSPGNPMYVVPIGGGLGGGPGGLLGGGKGFWAGLGATFGIAAAVVIGERVIDDIQTGFNNARTVRGGGVPTPGTVTPATIGPTVELNRDMFRAIGQLGISLSAGGDLATEINKIPVALRTDVVNAILKNPLQQQALHLTEEQLRYLDGLDGHIDRQTKQQAQDAAESRKNERDLIDEAKRGRLATAHAGVATARALHTLEGKLINDPKFKPKVDSLAQFIRLLKRTSEFGAKGVGTAIEHGPKTGRDPVGDAFVALVSRLDRHTLKNGQVQGEITRHIAALEGVQKDLLKDGNVAEARHAQRNIDRLNRLIGKVDQTIPHFRHIVQKINEEKEANQRGLSKIQANEAAIERYTGITSRKDPSPVITIPVTTNVTATLSTYQAVQQITRVGTITFGHVVDPRTIG